MLGMFVIRHQDRVAGGLHLLIGYALLGVLVVRMPRNTDAV